MQAVIRKVHKPTISQDSEVKIINDMAYLEIKRGADEEPDQKLATRSKFGQLLYAMS
jgi:hypothetical protein